MLDSSQKRDTEEVKKVVNKNKLKGAIVSAGFTQKTFAEALKMSKNSLNAKVNGNSRITMDEADRMCELLDIKDAAMKADIFLA